MTTPDSPAPASPAPTGMTTEQQQDREDKTEKSAPLAPNQQQEPTLPASEFYPHGVRACRGHWHVTPGGTGELCDEGLAIPGDPFPDEASARAAAAALDEVRALEYASASSFFTFEGKLAPNCYCPSCNALRSYTLTGAGCCPNGLSHGANCVCGATTLPERAPVPAVDKARSADFSVDPACTDTAKSVARPASDAPAPPRESSQINRMRDRP